jgi:alpha-L-fucosidase
VVRNLITCARGGGNYLLNIGPKPDGSIPEESVRILSAAGKWMDRNGPTIYESEPCQMTRSNYASFTRKGNTLYIHVYFWPGDTVTIGGLQPKVISARLFATGKKVEFEQDRFSVRFTGLPRTPPDDPVTVIAAECDAEPTQNMDLVRKERPRVG